MNLWIPKWGAHIHLKITTALLFPTSPNALAISGGWFHFFLRMNSLAESAFIWNDVSTTPEASGMALI